jgi:LAO/AO transport system kinase
VAVDPTSPFTGGALLGDRIRMSNISTDPGVFIRSMATRGALGGLATTTREVADLLDAFGFERVVMETVGVGQSELEIAGTADTCVVVLVPESGDSIRRRRRCRARRRAAPPGQNCSATFVGHPRYSVVPSPTWP